jgi:hypothetical protein
MPTTPAKSSATRAPSVKQRVADAGDRIGSGVDKAPLVALAGAAVVGALAGALLPRTERETELLGSVGNKLGKAAGDAVKAARDVGKQELGLLTGDQSPIDNLVQKALGAVSAAGSAAATSITSKRGG